MYETSLTKGQELVAQRMVKELRRQGHEAYLITGVFHDQVRVANAEEVDRLAYLQSFDEALGIPVVRVKSHQENWPPRRIAFEDFVSTLARIVDDLSLDVLITHSTLWNGPEETAKFVEWRRNQAKGGAPVRGLVFCHMSHFQEPSDERYDLDERTFREAWNSVSLRTITRVADFVLVATPYELNQMKVLGVQSSKCILFPGGIDSDRMEAIPVDFRAKYAIPAGRKLVTFVGTIEERKNPEAILEVAKALEKRDDVHFVIAGRLEGAYGHGVKARSEGLPNVTVTGPVPDEDIPSLIRDSYLNINLSRSEALGLSQLEFMFHGVPVVTSGVGGQSWIVRNGSSGVVLDGPEDVNGAAEAIGRLVDDGKKRDKLGERARQTAAQFTMPELIGALAGSIGERLARIGEASSPFEPGERIVEAWARKGERVAVTTKNLVIETAKEGKAVIVPLSAIVGIGVGHRTSKRLLMLGALASFGLCAMELTGLNWLAYVSSALGLVTRADPSYYWVAGFALALIPLAVSATYARGGKRRGFLVDYGADSLAFIPHGFEKAVGTIERLSRESFLERPLPE